MSFEILIMLCLLVLMAVLFVSEVIRIDVTGLTVLVLLGWLGYVPPEGLFSGFASNAVIAIIGVMIIGRGLDRAGLTSLIVQPILDFAGTREGRLVSSVSAILGVVSAFLQNIGAIALFLPSIMRVSSRTRLPLSRLLMPLGFAAILGGTLSMVGSSSLIVLNDLLRSAGLETFGLFDVTPLGVCLLLGGILYFRLLGPVVLPDREGAKHHPGVQQGLIGSWDLPENIRYVGIPPDSPLDQMNRSTVNLWEEYSINLLAIGESGNLTYAPTGGVGFKSGQVMILLGSRANIKRFVEDYGLNKYDRSRYERHFDLDEVGFAELIVPPRSSLIGTAIDEDSFREAYGVEPIVLLTRDKMEQGHIKDDNVQAGDTFVVHGRWNRLESMVNSGDFVSTDPIKSPSKGGSNAIIAGCCFLLAMVLAMTGPSLSLAMISGAVAMILTGVIDVGSAYDAIDWKTVFLLAALIPLGLAMENTGTAAYLAEGILTVVRAQHSLVVLFAIGLLTSLLALLMTNVAATILLVPFILNIGPVVEVNQRGLILLVGVCATNVFVLPTHQVNALIMSPGEYRTSDFLKAGTGMSLVYLVIAVFYVFLVYG